MSDRRKMSEVRISGAEEWELLRKVYAETYPVRTLLNEYDALAAELAEVKTNAARNNAIADEMADRCHKAEARVAALEAALRDLIDYSDITKRIDADAVTERVKRARVVLGLATVETGGK